MVASQFYMIILEVVHVVDKDKALGNGSRGLIGGGVGLSRAADIAGADANDAIMVLHSGWR